MTTAKEKMGISVFEWGLFMEHFKHQILKRLTNML